MIRLDREGLEYLLQCCRDIGFEAHRIATTEDELEPPTVTITFAQTRIAETPQKQAPERDVASGQIIDDAGEFMLDGTKL
jgi:hypothetical protein